MNLYKICDSNQKFIYFLCERSNFQHNQRIFQQINKNLTFY